MSEPMKKAIAEYRRIAELFRNDDPVQDNGWSLACDAIMRGARI